MSELNNTTTIQPRDYQLRAINTSRSKIAAGTRRVCLNSPTGSGKTVIAAGIVQLAVAKGKRVLFLAHRRELIEQTADKLISSGVLNFGVIMAGDKRVNPDAPVQVASIKTLIRRELPAADLIIIDEAHRAASRSYLNILANYPDAVVLGLTATPERLDGKGLDDIFDELVVVETVPNLIEQGFLIKPTCYVGPTGDLSGVKTKRGDYDEAQLAEAMDQPKLTGDIVANWKRLANGKKTVVFASSVEHAKHISQEFFNAGVSAAWVSGDTPKVEREATIADWRSGAITIVANCQIFVEGFDLPELECCILARPTQSVSMYLQMVGRIMRPAHGKADALVLDHAGCCIEHGSPHIHREWTLEGMTKKRKKREQDSVLVCDACNMAFDSEPGLWLAETQPTLLPAFTKRATEVLRAPKKARAVVVCPGCSSAKCPVCQSLFHAKKTSVDIDGVGSIDMTICTSCKAQFESDAPAIYNDGDRQEDLPYSTDDDLILMSDDVPVKVAVLNEYRRLINEARKNGHKRGWAYWRLREQYDESTLRDCLPRHTGNWWRAQA